ncbi:ComEC/Rec2 family competence protein [Isachenkonia alkalipeptolytica]|uniref:MBL fold metallo-hydrolase n=1 Tax=Isachenkonia alkalipeptolytica TaxID=2565777 RepID=A0AA43XJS6_9CLOT|nr:ComEC/Rec2 family competence protein [Isachenkonia alkalipeptolytica]NBG87922.1 MBL fold metallo-hydrolase [Isachenkonia alkalipeptolytica]
MGLQKTRAKIFQSPIFFFLFLLLIITSFLFFFNVFSGEDASLLRVHYIDVDQGDSILIQTPGNQNILIDGGERNQGEYVKGYLQNQGVKHLHMVVGTHPHSDHIGGLGIILEHFPADMILLPPVSHTTQTFEDLLHTIEEKNVPLIPVPSPEAYTFEENLTLEFLGPHLDFQDHLNNWSVVLKMTYKNHGFLFTGDIESAAESALLQGYPLETLSADVLKVPHHGSSTSSTAPFLEAVAPRVSIISCGKENPYGHPHKETIERLLYFSSDLYRTDIHGTILLKSNGVELWSPTAPFIPENIGK